MLENDTTPTNIPDDFDFPKTNTDTETFIETGLTDHPQGFLHDDEPFIATTLYQYAGPRRAAVYQFFYNLETNEVGVCRLTHFNIDPNGVMHDVIETVVDPEDGRDAIISIDNLDGRTIESKDDAVNLLYSYLPDYALVKGAATA